MKQFFSADPSFLGTTDQVLGRPDHITVSFADEAGKNFSISATNGHKHTQKKS
jgi:hypothetical protein